MVFFCLDNQAAQIHMEAAFAWTKERTKKSSTIWCNIISLQTFTSYYIIVCKIDVLQPQQK